MIKMREELPVSFVRGEYNMTMLGIYASVLENGTGSHVFQHLERAMPTNFHGKMHGYRRDH
jgi:hypothetical protein